MDALPAAEPPTKRYNFYNLEGISGGYFRSHNATIFIPSKPTPHTYEAEPLTLRTKAKPLPIPLRNLPKAAQRPYPLKFRAISLTSTPIPYYYEPIRIIFAHLALRVTDTFVFVAAPFCATSFPSVSFCGYKGVTEILIEVTIF